MLKLSQIKSLLAQHGIKPHKRMGQNFLADGNMLRAIVRDAEVDKRSCVLEIGTGTGSLANALCEEAGLVITVEADRGMFGVARDALSDAKNIVMLQANALSEDGSLNGELAGLIYAYISKGLLHVESSAFDDTQVQIEGKPPKLGTLRCVSNLPYSAAGPIIVALLESALQFERIVVMVQYEVGEKLCAEVGRHAYGILSLIRAQFADARILRRVPKWVFWPKPKVDSAIVELRPYKKKPDKASYLRLKHLAHVLFQHRRKQGSNALAIALDVPAATAEQWMQAADADPNARPEDIPHAALQRLADLPELAKLARDRAEKSRAEAAEKEARAKKRARWRKPRDEEE